MKQGNFYSSDGIKSLCCFNVCLCSSLNWRSFIDWASFKRRIESNIKLNIYSIFSICSLSWLRHGVLGSWSGLLVLWLVFVKLHKLGQIESWFLEDLNFSDNAAIFLKREDFSTALFLNLSSNISLNPTQINLIIN